MPNISFTKIYENLKTEPTPCAKFVKDMATLTNRAEGTVRKWIAGDVVPDINVQNILASHFNTEKEILFPNKESKCDESR